MVEKYGQEERPKNEAIKMKVYCSCDKIMNIVEQVNIADARKKFNMNCTCGNTAVVVQDGETIDVFIKNPEKELVKQYSDAIEELDMKD